MTSTLEPTTVSTDPAFALTSDPAATAIREAVTHDIYANVHKGIRAELFRVTASAGRLDPSERCAREGLLADTRELFAFLVSHAQHEDEFVQPLLEVHAPHYADVIAADHPRLEARMADIATRVERAADAPAVEQRARVHDAYRELAAFTGSYLEHQDFEERHAMPALERAIGVDEVVAVDGAIVASIPPDQVARGLGIMLPAMNLDDRVELLGGMQAGAPPEVFAGVWALAGSVLTPADHAALAARLGIR